MGEVEGKEKGGRVAVTFMGKKKFFHSYCGPRTGLYTDPRSWEPVTLFLEGG